MRFTIDEMTKPARPKAPSDSDTDHLYCECDPDTSLCGFDISGSDFLDAAIPDNRLCFVCDDLCEKPCPQCGL